MSKENKESRFLAATKDGCVSSAYLYETEILFHRLQSALANLDAAFPAGDYGLNSRQNAALNDILDVSFDMSQRIETYRKELDSAKERVRKEQEEEMYAFSGVDFSENICCG